MAISIKPEMAYNYDKMSTSNWIDQNEIYDWKSNMHYEWYYFITDEAMSSGGATMTVKGNAISGIIYLQISMW